MATYLLIALDSFAEPLDSAVESGISQEHRHKIESGKWLISSTRATSKDVSDSLGISTTTTFFIAPIRGYFGRAKPDIWEWLAAKAETVNA